MEEFALIMMNNDDKWLNLINLFIYFRIFGMRLFFSNSKRKRQLDYVNYEQISLIVKILFTDFSLFTANAFLFFVVV